MAEGDVYEGYTGGASSVGPGGESQVQIDPVAEARARADLAQAWIRENEPTAKLADLSAKINAAYAQYGQDLTTWPPEAARQVTTWSDQMDAVAEQYKRALQDDQDWSRRYNDLIQGDSRFLIDAKGAAQQDYDLKSLQIANAIADLTLANAEIAKGKAAASGDMTAYQAASIAVDQARLANEQTKTRNDQQISETQLRLNERAEGRQALNDQVARLLQEQQKKLVAAQTENVGVDSETARKNLEWIDRLNASAVALSNAQTNSANATARANSETARATALDTEQKRTGALGVSMDQLAKLVKSGKIDLERAGDIYQSLVRGGSPFEWQQEANKQAQQILGTALTGGMFQPGGQFDPQGNIGRAAANAGLEYRAAPAAPTSIPAFAAQNGLNLDPRQGAPAGQFTAEGQFIPSDQPPGLPVAPVPAFAQTAPARRLVTMTPEQLRASKAAPAVAARAMGGVDLVPWFAR